MSTVDSRTLRCPPTQIKTNANIPTKGPDILLVFDFDKTVIDVDSDRKVIHEIGADSIFEALYAS